MVLKKNFKKIVLPLLAICLLGIVVYSNTFQVPFQFDDKLFIVQNSAIKNIAGIGPIWDMLSQPSRFVGFYSFALNHHFHELNVVGYHVVNLLIHLITACLVWWLVRMLNRLRTSGVRKSEPPRFGDGYGSTVALFAALIFVVHPVQTQAVTYITQRMASLATLFYLLSLCFYVKGRYGGTRLITFVHFFGAAVAAVLGMFTKEIVITLPLMILLIEHFFLKTKKLYVIPILLFFLIVPAIFSFDISGMLLGEKTSLSHQGDVITFGKYIITQFRVMATFLKLSFFPIGQNLDYDFPLSHNFFEVPVFVSFIVLLGVIGAAFKFKQRNIWISFGIFWFLLTLSPNFVPRQHVIFEHKLYLSMAGGALFLVAWFFSLFKNFRKCVAALSLIVCVLSFLTYQRNKVWLNEVTLWEDVVKKSPHKLRPHLNLGAAYLKHEQYDTALQHFEKVLDIDTDYAEGYSARGVAYEAKGLYDLALVDYEKATQLDPYLEDVYSNRGVIYEKAGQWDLALADYEKALSINPNYKEAYYNRGVIYEKTGRYDLALKDMNKAVDIDPKYAKVYSNRGIIYKMNGQYDKALADYDKAIEINPNLAEAYGNRGVINKLKGQLDEALADYSRALALNAEMADGYYNRGIVYEMKGQWDLALADYNHALRINPEYATAYNNRGIVYKRQKQYDRALVDYGKALEVNPNLVEAYSNRGVVYKEQGKYDLAIADFTKALEINPQLHEIYNNRGAVYKVKKQWNLALADFQKAMLFDAQNYSYLFNRATVYEKLKQYQRAIEDVDVFLQANPTFGAGYYVRSRIYLAKGDRQKALEDARTAKALGFVMDETYLENIQSK